MAICRDPHKLTENGNHIFLCGKHPPHKSLHKLCNTYACNSIDLSTHLFHNSVYWHSLRSNLDILAANFLLYGSSMSRHEKGINALYFDGQSSIIFNAASLECTVGATRGMSQTG